MVNEYETSARASVAPKIKNPKKIEKHEAAPPSVEKLYDMYKFLHGAYMDLKEQNQSQQDEISKLKNQLFKTAVNVESLKTCLRVCLKEDPDNYNEDFLRGLERLSGLTDSQINADAHFTSEKELLPSTSTFCNQIIDTCEEPSKPALQLVNIDGENEQMENPTTTVTECISPRLIDCDTIVRTLLCIASQKRMTVKHFRKKWSNEIGVCLEANQFEQSLTVPHLYVQSNGESAIYWTGYTDDFLLAATNIKRINEIANLLKKFAVEDLGILSCVQNMEIRLNNDGIFCINQSKFIENLLWEFNIKDVKLSGIPMNSGYLKARKNTQPMPSNTKYQSLIAFLADLAMKSRPDIAVSVQILSQFIDTPTESDWKEAKKIVRYLKGTANCELRLGQNNPTLNLVGYADANWNAGQMSNSGYMFLLNGSPICWASVKQNNVVESSVDAECVALKEATCQGLPLQALIKDLTGKDIQITMFEDNQRCLKLIDSQDFMSKIKKENAIEFQYCPSIEMVADMLTKPLDKNKLRELSEKCGLLFLKDSQPK